MRTPAEKAQIQRIRRLAIRQDLELVRSRTKYTEALTFQRHWIYDRSGKLVSPPEGLNADATELWLRGAR